MRGQWLSAVAQGNGHILGHTRLDQADARYRRDARGDRQRDPFGTGEYGGKMRLVIERRLRGEQRLVGRNRRHQHRYAASQYEGNADDLAAHAGEIADQLAVQHAHQLISSGARRCSFTTVRAMAPSARCTTRSAMLAIAALCVMTITVVPRV